MRKLTVEDFQKRLIESHPKEKLTAISWNGSDKECQVKCETCETIYIKKGYNFIDPRKVSICKKCFPT